MNETIGCTMSPTQYNPYKCMLQLTTLDGTGGGGGHLHIICITIAPGDTVYMCRICVRVKHGMVSLCTSNSGVDSPLSE